jgi:hypothetical protein
MTEWLVATRHAAIRMAQRSISLRDADLIAMLGSAVADGYLVREKDYQAVERRIKHLLVRVRRLRGKRLVVANGRIITAFHVTRRQQRRLLRNTAARDLQSYW